jgi:hypothetical protein
LDWVDIRALGRHRQDHRTAKTDDTLGTEYRIRVSRLRLRRSALSFEHSLDPLSPWTSALTGSPLHLVGVGSLMLPASPPHACSHHRIDGRWAVNLNVSPTQQDLVLLLLPPLLGSVNLNLYLWLALMHLQPSQCWNPYLSAWLLNGASLPKVERVSVSTFIILILLLHPSVSVCHCF